MGGDEFAFLLGHARPGDAAALAERLLEKLREPFTVYAQEVFLTGSIGIAEASRRVGEPATRGQLLRDADLAMYVAKEAGRDRSAVFEPEMRARTAQRLTLQTDLQHAIARGQLHLVYQPIGRWILREAIRRTATWRRGVPGHDELRIAVNVSGRQLQGLPFVTDVRDALELEGLAPRAVTLEITESMLLTDSDSISAQLRALKDFGVGLAIDDFGTGYSSLSYLTRFPLDVMKLDKSFLAGIAESPDRQALLRSIIDMGHSLHLRTLGEGIETRAELNRLRACGCDLGQGFLFAPPLTAEQATHRLTDTARARSAVTARP